MECVFQRCWAWWLGTKTLAESVIDVLHVTACVNMYEHAHLKERTYVICNM